MDFNVTTSSQQFSLVSCTNYMRLNVQLPGGAEHDFVEDQIIGVNSLSLQHDIHTVRSLYCEAPYRTWLPLPYTSEDDEIGRTHVAMIRKPGRWELGQPGKSENPWHETRRDGHLSHTRIIHEGR